MVEQSDILEATRFTTQPFRVIPPREMKVIWAGDRATIDDLIEASRSPSPSDLHTSEFITIFGSYGSGKTHALKFVSNHLQDAGNLVIYIPRPNISEKSTWSDLVREMFSTHLRRDDIKARFDKLRNSLLGRVQQEINARTQASGFSADVKRQVESETSEALCSQILPESPGFVRFCMDLADESKSERNWKYLTNKMSQKEVAVYAQEYGVPVEGMASDSTAGALLSYFMNVMTYQTDLGAGSDVCAVLIDETENVNDLSPVARRSFLVGIRDLVNKVPEHLFLAMALATSDASELYGILDEPSMMRVTRQPFEFHQHTIEEGIQFLSEIMAEYRVEGYSGDQAFPFTDEGLEEFVTACPPPRSARTLLLSAQRIVFHKCREKVLSGDRIDADDVAEFNDWASG